jgi:hypothetical protein
MAQYIRLRKKIRIFKDNLHCPVKRVSFVDTYINQLLRLPVTLFAFKKRSAYQTNPGRFGRADALTRRRSARAGVVGVRVRRPQATGHLHTDCVIRPLDKEQHRREAAQHYSPCFKRAANSKARPERWFRDHKLECHAAYRYESCSNDRNKEHRSDKYQSAHCNEKHRFKKSQPGKRHRRRRVSREGRPCADHGRYCTSYKHRLESGHWATATSMTSEVYTLGIYSANSCRFIIVNDDCMQRRARN